MDTPKTAAPNFLTLRYQENLYAQLDQLVEVEKQLDGLVIDLMQTGFSLPLESLNKFMIYAMKLLNHGGLLLLIKSDGALCLAKDDPAGGFNIKYFDSPLGFASRYPSLAEYARFAVSGIEARYIESFNSSLARHILGASIPILTAAGKKHRHDFTLDLPQNRLVQLIDDYTSVEAILHILETRHDKSSIEALHLLKEMESGGVIFPLFARVDFLTKCYQNKKPFRLGRFMVESGLLSEAQLQLLLEQQAEDKSVDSTRTLLGLLAVRAGFINNRVLQSILVDQFLYGGYHRRPDSELAGLPENSIVEIFRDSMIGSLGAIDTPGLLQSLATANKTGLLTIEDGDKLLQLQVLEGRPTYAKMNKLRGNDAISEFVTTWTEGIFVFKDKGVAKELDESCRIPHNLSRILLDAGLYQDNIDFILNFLPQRQKTVLERRANIDQSWEALEGQPLKMIDETTVTPEDRRLIGILAGLIDGFTSVDEIVKAFDRWPTHKVLKSLYLLMEHGLISVQKSDLFGPLSVFQKIALEVESLIGREANKVLLQASLYYVHGESNAADTFQIDHSARISVNMNHMKTSGVPVSTILVELRQWMEAYLAYCRQKVGAGTIDTMVAAAVKKNS